MATAALTSVRALLDDHPTEHEFGLAIDTEIRRLGAEGTSFETIVLGQTTIITGAFVTAT